MNNQHQAKINYKGYARKSSEAEDKQVLSIPSQVADDIKFSLLRNIKVGETDFLTEEKSAKTPHGRPAFETLVKSIEGGEIQGIITWHPNRLSRNPIDAARLVDLMDRGKLIEIATQQQTFRNTPNDKFIFALLCLQAKMENDNKSIDVKRGLRKKYEMGFPPSLAKPGYINDCGEKGKRKWLPDTKLFSPVKQLFELFLTGQYSVRKLLRYSDEVLGIKTIQRKKEGGKPIKLSQLYSMLEDPLYAGFFYANDENGEQKRYEVNESVPRMITEEHYWQIQTLLGRKGRPCPSVNKRSFAYVGRTKCGTCGGAVTAEHKHQLICSNCKKKFSYQNKTNCPYCGIKIEDMENPKYLHYIYYHCTKRRTPDCPEGSIQEKYVNESVASYFENNLKISSSLKDWCINHLDELEKNDRQNEFERRAVWEIEKEKKENEYKEYIVMKGKKLIDDDEFLTLKASIKADLEKIEKTLSGISGGDTSALERAKHAFSLAVGVAETFRNGSFDEKTGALSDLGSNLTLKDKKLEISSKKLISIIINGLLEAKTQNRAFEPAKIEVNKGKTEVFASVCPTLLRG